MKKITTIVLLSAMMICLQKNAQAQLSLSYYSSDFSKVGLAFNAKRIWTELRVYGNFTLKNTTPELVFCVDILSTENSNLYIGFGGNVNFYQGIIMPIGLQFTPFEKLANFSLHIELQPMYDFNQEDVLQQSSWGIRYTFGKKK